MTSVQFVRSPSRNESPMPSSSTHASALNDKALFVLPVDTMDVEVFERYIMKVLTSLHRLAGKISYDIDAAGVGKKTALTTTDNSANATVLWTLVRRVTRRIEKLRAMEEVLEMKRKSLAAIQQRHAGHGKRTPVNSQQLQGDIFLVEALQAKLVASVSQFEELETNVMEKLCAI